MKILSFKGGIHPLKEIHEGKGATKEGNPGLSAGNGLHSLGSASGSSSVPVVKKGDLVKVGQVIADRPVPGIPVHASVSGE